VACSDSGPGPKAAAPTAAKPAQTPVSKVTTTKPAEAPQEEFVYNALGRRDPFATIIEAGPKAQATGDRPPLERHDIYDFKLSGIVWGGFGYNAMMESPDGKGYFVRQGTVIGRNKGVVKKIEKNRIIIEEKFKNFSGETERKEIVVEFRKNKDQEGLQ
jgi:type IV pilus assembly protein PilP